MNDRELVVRVIDIQSRRLVVPTAHIQDVILTVSRVLAGLDSTDAIETLGVLLYHGRIANERLGNPTQEHKFREPIPLGRTMEELRLEEYQRFEERNADETQN